jgi:hypothetical protein
MVYYGDHVLSAHLRVEIGNAVWNKLYRSRVFDGLRFPEGRVHEDVAFVYRAIMRCRRVASISRVGYHYVMREGSIAHSHDMKALADCWAAHKERYDCLIASVPKHLGEELVDEGLRGELALGPASAISGMWRWAYANGPQERAAYDGLLREMQRFEREVLRGVDKRGWPARVAIPLLLARSRSGAALAAEYYASQVVLHLFPERSASHR